MYIIQIPNDVKNNFFPHSDTKFEIATTEK